MKKVLLIILIGTFVNVKAQEFVSTQDFAGYQLLQPAPPATGHKMIYPDGYIQSVMPELEHKEEISLFLGTQGFGGDFRYEFLPKVSGRVGAGFIPVDIPNAFSVNSFNSQINMNINFINVHVIADMLPFGNSGIRVGLGGAYFLKGTAKGVVTSDTAKYGNIVLTPQQMGKITITSTWTGFAPYLGLGFLRTFPRLFFDVNIDVGTYYLAAPRTTIVATGALTPNDANNTQFQQNISNYRWLPVLQVNFNFKL